MNQLDLFAGLGGFSLAAKWFGIETTQFVEIEPFCQNLLRKNFPHVPIHADITDYYPRLGEFDIVTFGSPCQDFSSANPNGRGLEGERSGLFFEAIRIIRTIRPRFAIFENVPNVLNRGFDRILWEFSNIGFDAEWQIISAASLGAPHLRKRLFVIAYPTCTGTRADKVGIWARLAGIDGRANPTTSNPQSNGRRQRECGGNHSVQQCHWPQSSEIGDRQPSTRPQPSQGPTQSRICGMDARLSPWVDGHHPSPLATGIPHYQKRLKALGNTVVPQCAAIAYQRILEIHASQTHFND